MLVNTVDTAAIFLHILGCSHLITYHPRNYNQFILLFRENLFNYSPINTIARNFITIIFSNSNKWLPGLCYDCWYGKPIHE